MDNLVALVFTLLLAILQSATPDTQPIIVRVKPDPVYIERAGHTQLLTFDFELVNQTEGALDLREIRMKGYDSAERLLVWEKLDSNGGRPAIETLGVRRLEPLKPMTVFNPFFQLDTAVPIKVLRYEFFFASASGARMKAAAEVHPVIFHQKTRLIVPLAGARVWAYEGPGLYSHHRRIDLADPFTRDKLGIRRNGQRYALDLVVLDKDGEAFHGDASKFKENWAGSGFPIVAPAGGSIVAAVGDFPDDVPFDQARLEKDPRVQIGNYVLIDHHTGEYSLLAHMEQGSVAVKVGDQVARGQLLGRMGHSGMGSGLVHLHYELRDTADLFDANGLPARYEGFRRIGSPRNEVGRIAPGWVIITPAVQPEVTKANKPPGGP